MSLLVAHPWHGVSVGKNAPAFVNAVIEIQKGSKQKYEIDKNSGLLFLDRVYPTNYGFIPQTYCEDGDALDILVLGQDPVFPMSIMNAKVIGCMRMIDGGEEDDKILAVHAHDPQYKHINELEDVAPHILQEITQFFKSYKALEKKTVEVKNWISRVEAEKIILKSVEMYKNNKTKLISDEN
jgi:inorganic pyrophosphatase